ncbi:MAG: Hpt domain-containing protein [Flavobacteriaceae bacterium]|nr:Hpt domain-containing protein [Flavobacteriaceae bacterium]
MEPNFNQIEEICAGDISFRNRMIMILKKEFPVEYEELTLLIEKKKYSKSAELVHKIKHKIALLGMEKSYDVAVNFENELKNGKMTLYSEFLLILDKIDQFLKNT